MVLLDDDDDSVFANEMFKIIDTVSAALRMYRGGRPFCNRVQLCKISNLVAPLGRRRSLFKGLIQEVTFWSQNDQTSKNHNT